MILSIKAWWSNFWADPTAPPPPPDNHLVEMGEGMVLVKCEGEDCPYCEMPKLDLNRDFS